MHDVDIKEPTLRFFKFVSTDYNYHDTQQHDHNTYQTPTLPSDTKPPDLMDSHHNHVPGTIHMLPSLEESRKPT